MDNEIMDEIAGLQQKNSKEERIARLQPHQWKKGQSGNPKGRPDGKSLKEFAKEMLNRMNDEEREEFFEGLDKKVIWEMAEGKAMQGTDITSAGQAIQPILVKFLDAESNSDTQGI